MPLVPASIHRFSQSGDQFGESPTWIAETATLWWVDIAGRALRSRSLAGEERRHALDEEPGCIAPAADGRLLVALRSQVALFDPRDGALERLCGVPWDPATTRSNDGRCDPHGRFWVGTVFEPKTAPLAGLYRLGRDAAGGWALHQELDGNLTANGLAFSPDGRHAWWSNTPEHVTWRYAFDAHAGRFGAAEEFRRFARRQAGQPYGGRPDGAAADSAGAYWVAMYEGGRVLRLAPDGSVLLDLALPVSVPTMVCLGGERLRTLFVTTVAKGRPPEELQAQPDAGHVLAVELDALGVDAGVSGLPTAHFDPSA